VNEESKEQEYSKIRRRINILGGVVFVGVATAFVLTATQVFNAAWTEWWVGVGGLLFGFAIALASSVMMDYAVGREYELISLSLWEYVLVRFQFLFILFLVPLAITVVIGAIVTTYYRGPLVWSILLLRGMAFIVLIVFAGFVLPYLFGKITGAESVGRDTRSLVDNIANKIGVTIQEVYRVPLEGLRRANAVQIGFVEGKKVVFLLGSWEKHFTKDELGAVLAHEFAHAKYNHIRKLLIAQLLCRLGVPGLIFLSIDFAITVLQIPKPAPVGVILAFVGPALVLLLGSVLFPAWLSRKYETQVDSEAAEVCGADAMISALRELAELNPIPKERSHLLSTHPSFGERIRALKSSDAL
jgi:STE24 endopeptidase